MPVLELKKKELLDKVYWVIALRNITVGVTVFLGAIGALAAKLSLPLILGLQLGVIVLIYNGMGWLLLKRKESFLSSRQIVYLCFGQLIADAVVVTLLIHFTGGILSPFILMYLFGIIIIGMIIPEKPLFSGSLALITVFLYEGLLVLERFGIFSPVMIIQEGQEVYQDIGLFFYRLIVFPVFSIITVFLSINLSLCFVKGKTALRQRITQLTGARKHLKEALSDLGRKTSEVSILYEIAARGSFPLAYFVSRLAEMMRAETVEILLFEDRNKLKTAAAYGFPAPEILPAAALNIPLLHDGRKIGELRLNRFTGSEFGGDEKRILTIIAERIASAIEGERSEKDREKLEGNLKEKVVELEGFHNLAVGRELKMIELEKEIERLKNK